MGTLTNERESVLRDIEQAGIRPMELLRAVKAGKPIDLAQNRGRAAAQEIDFVAQRLGLRGESFRRFEKALGVSRPIQGGSFLTGTNVELLYASIAAATALGTFTTEDNLQKTLPPVIIPAGFFYSPGSIGKSLRVVARGRLTTTGTPTFLWTSRLLTSTTWSGGGLAIGASGTLTGNAVTNAFWVLQQDITLRALGIAGASTIVSMGLVECPSGVASPFATTIPATAGTVTLATLDNAVTYYYFLSATCSASSGSNTIQLEMLKVFGEN